MPASRCERSARTWPRRNYQRRPSGKDRMPPARCFVSLADWSACKPAQKSKPRLGCGKGWNRPEAVENKRVVAGLLPGLRAWLLQAAAFNWSEAEFQAVAETLARFDAFDLLQEYARAARRRDPANPAWRFHDIVARTRGNADRLSMAETDDLFEMAAAAARREDFHAAKRIERFLNGNGRVSAGRGKAAVALPDTIDDDEMAALFMAMMDEMPKGSADSLRGLVNELGRDATVAQMVEELRSSPIGPGMPEPLLRQLSEAMVAKAMDGSRSRHGGKTRRSRLFDA